MRGVLVNLGLALGLHATGAVGALEGEARAMLMDSMSWMDKFWDPKLGQLFDVNANANMNHETLPSAWYAVGLLARNGNDGADVKAAERTISNLVANQHKDPTKKWFGGYTREAEEPDVGTPAYPAKEWGSWDPNWRSFVGLSLVTIYEEYGDLISSSTKDLILESMRNCSIGDSIRGGGLYPAYSNPAIMRAVGSGWTGRKIGNETMVKEAEEWAKQIIDLFDKHGTLSEFNSATYTGISLFGLTLWHKYTPEDSIMNKRGPDMIRSVWNTTSQLWHAGMRNLAGPWDRSYGFDMNRHLGHLSLFLAPLIGRQESALHKYPEIMSHGRDWGWAPLVAVHSDAHNAHLSDELKQSLKTFAGEHTWTGQAYYPPHDLESRNVTVWMGEKLTIGAQSYRSKGNGGPSNNQGQFHPAVAQWVREDGEIGWLGLRSSQSHVIQEVSAGRLKITYPKGDASSVFTLWVSPSVSKPNIASWADVDGPSIKVSGNVVKEPTVAFAGRYGGAAGAWYDHNYWRLEHKMPAGFQGTPELILEFSS